MLPIIINIGPVKIYSYGLFLSLGLLISLYYYWKMGRDEHLDEISLFDSFFISLLSFFVFGRILYIALMSPQLNLFTKGMAILTHPGLVTFAGLVGSLLALTLISKAKNWEFWKVMDMAAVTYSVAFIFGAIGSLLSGANSGKYFSWSIDALSVIYAVIMFVIVYRIRKNFRFYAWYKGDKAIARDGLSALSFVLLVGIYYICRFFLENTYYLPILGFGIVAMITSLLGIYLRSGRKIAFFSVQLMRKRRSI